MYKNLLTVKRTIILNAYFNTFNFWGPNTGKTANVLKYIETNKVKKEHFYIKQYNTIYKTISNIIFFEYRTRQIKTTEIIK